MCHLIFKITWKFKSPSSFSDSYYVWNSVCNFRLLYLRRICSHISMLLHPLSLHQHWHQYLPGPRQKLPPNDVHSKFPRSWRNCSQQIVCDLYGISICCFCTSPYGILPARISVQSFERRAQRFLELFTFVCVIYSYWNCKYFSFFLSCVCQLVLIRWPSDKVVLLT